MKKIILLFIFIAGAFFQLQAQDQWHYVGKVHFPDADTGKVRPFLCTVDENDRLYVVSSKATDLLAINAIFYADPGDTVLTKMIDYDENGDSDSLTGNVGAIRGIVCIGNDVLMNASQPYPKTAPNTVATIYYYYDGNALTVDQFGWGLTGSGYGSYIHGAAATSDSIVVCGISYLGPSHRWYNFSQGNDTLAGFGSYVQPPANQVEIGGPETGGRDLIRDVEVLRDGDYSSPNTPFYTTRNSYSATQLSGGISYWSSGTQYDPENYTSARVTDFNGFLSLIDPIPYGIDLDANGILWVAGTDSTRRWVKGFSVQGINALDEYDLPAMYSEDIPDPNGAPMTGPSDVVLTADTKTAYVTDLYSRSVYKFVYGTVGVEDDFSMNYDFNLEQNYPNPFNPATKISFTLPNKSNVRLVVTDMLGREVAELVNGNYEEGRHVVTFAAENLASGTYIYTLTAGGMRTSKKMLYIK